MNTEELIAYYNKFNEDKRLNTRHGQVEYRTCMHYIEWTLKQFKNPRILDIGAGTGKYAIPLSENYHVDALELVKHNLRVIEQKGKKVHTHLGNALDLSLFETDSYEVILLFGPMYHLLTFAEKIQALKEAKRVLKPNGILLINYFMNDYCVITHGFKDGKIKESIEKGMLDEQFHITDWDNSLYSVVRLEDIDALNQEAGLKRVKIVTSDGPANYLRSTLNKMDDDTFERFMKYHFATCERLDMLGASAHVLDIVTK